MSNEFTKCISRIYTSLKIIGLSPDFRDDQRNILIRLYHHPLYVLHMISLNLTIIGKLQWLRDAFQTGKSFLEITYCFPCFTLGLLSDFISFSALNYAQHINDLLERLEMLQLDLIPTKDERDIFISQLVGKNTSELLSITKKTIYLIATGVFLFSTRPMFEMYSHYTNTGEVLYSLPLYVSYPFDKTDMRIFPFVYAHQIFAGAQALLLVNGPSCFYFTCCTFIHIQFIILQYDIEHIVNADDHNFGITMLKENMKKLIKKHVELLRCVELLEIIYSKCILFNAFTSSMMICVTGFNIMANDNILTIAFFTSFLMLSLLQIFFFCYYGDNITCSSTQVSDAIYKSQWYNIDAKERQIFLIMLVRAQRPCKVTAYGFFDVNLRAFTSVLSKSWSYFALLKTIYNPE